MRRTTWGFIIAVVLLCCNQELFAQSGNRSITNISFGAYTESYESDRVSGTAWTISHKRFFTDRWAWFAGLGSGSAVGEHELDDGSTVDLSSSRSSLSGGLKWHYIVDSKQWITPYVGAGLSVQTYSYDFNYNGSKIGSTSGTGYGPLFMAGARMDIADHFLIIPGYQFEQIHIESEHGDRVTVTSAGFMLALVIRF